MTVTVTVTMEIELGMLAGETRQLRPTWRTAYRTPLETYTANGPVTPAWSLSGDDADDFSIGSGMLMFRATPDFEAPTDMGMDNMYMVTVMAEAGGEMDMMDVTVTVTNVEEMGEVTLWAGNGCPHDAAAGWRHNHGGCGGRRRRDRRVLAVVQDHDPGHDGQLDGHRRRNQRRLHGDGRRHRTTTCG